MGKVILEEHKDRPCRVCNSTTLELDLVMVDVFVISV